MVGCCVVDDARTVRSKDVRLDLQINTSSSNIIRLIVEYYCSLYHLLTQQSTVSNIYDYEMARLLIVVSVDLCRRHHPAAAWCCVSPKLPSGGLLGDDRGGFFCCRCCNEGREACCGINGGMRIRVSTINWCPIIRAISDELWMTETAYS